MEQQQDLQLYRGYSDHDLLLFDQFEQPNCVSQPGFVVDFIGTKIRTSLLWQSARALDGQRLQRPVPADFHAETIEWVGVLRSVALAEHQYRAMELGAGFGPWSVASALAARHRGIEDIRLCAVEADPYHFASLVQHFLDNDLNPALHLLLQAGVGPASGCGFWSTNGAPEEDWGGRLLTHKAGHDYRGKAVTNLAKVSVIGLPDLICREPIWDLIHIDVQGDEFTICSASLAELNSRVRRVVVATHSRKLDGDIFDLFWSNKWILENEKPARILFSANAPTLDVMTSHDGTQVWANPNLAARRASGSS